MGKKIILYFIVLLLIVSFAFATTTLVYDETDLISLQTEATDPDSQDIIYYYSEPLDENGEWQTTYGDAGEYIVTVTVSDGELNTSQDATIIVNKKDEKPIIDTFVPKEDLIIINEDETVSFEVSASDINKDSLTYEWFIDGVSVNDETAINYVTDYKDEGKHNVKVVVSDEVFDVSKEWIVEVKDFDLEGILDSIEDIVVEETDIVSLQLPDLEKYGLDLSVSDPVGNDNKWETGYDDAGVHKVTVKAEGKGFSGSKKIEITVENKDRAPVLVDLKDITISENEEILIELEAEDPDDDEITFSVQNMPDNATLDENIFRWKPDFDFVNKKSSFDYVLDKFRLLSKSIDVVFIAESNENEVQKRVKITVKDSNRPFAFELLKPITVNEGEEVIIEPRYYDKDGDSVSFKYSGWMTGNTYRTNLDDAGTYIVKLTGNDGFYKRSQFATVNVKNVNRKPVFKSLKNVEVTENEKIKVELKAHDVDNDIISFSGENLPKNSRVEGNTFIFEPDFDFVRGKEKEQVYVKLFADDGEAKDEQVLGVTVLNKNRAPKIIDFSKELIVKVDEPVTLYVLAEDPDDDSLTYLWDFGLFEKHSATAVHKRTFVSKGKKEVEVVVSDGVYEAVREFLIDVV